MKIAIKAEPRSVQGTGASRRLRRESKVPGILYGAGKDAQPIEVDHKELWFKLKMEAFHASILDMELGAEKSQVLLRDYQMHPFRPIVLHVDFQRVDGKTCTKIRQLSVAFLFAETIRRISDGESVTSLFSEQNNNF